MSDALPEHGSEPEIDPNYWQNRTAVDADQKDLIGATDIIRFKFKDKQIELLDIDTQGIASFPARSNPPARGTVPINISMNLSDYIRGAYKPLTALFIPLENDYDMRLTQEYIKNAKKPGDFEEAEVEEILGSKPCPSMRQSNSLDLQYAEMERMKLAIKKQMGLDINTTILGTPCSLIITPANIGSEHGMVELRDNLKFAHQIMSQEASRG